MITILSALDERLRPKGSRDPLGIEAVWSHVGRRVVGHLTTVSSSLDGFIVALLCCHYANGEKGELDHIQLRFLQAEQVAAYLQLAANTSGYAAPSMLGITRARRNFEKDKIVLGRSAVAQILSEQLSYGLWGLYSSPLTGVGLIKGVSREPTEQGLQVISRIIEVLGQSTWNGFQALCQRRQIKREDLTPFANSFRTALANRKLRQQVVEVLLNNQRGAVLQTELYAQAENYLRQHAQTRSPQSFNTWIQKNSINPDMRAAMERMNALEPLLAIAEKIMGWLQHEGNRPRLELEQKVTQSMVGLQLSDKWQLIPGLPHREFLTKLLNAINAADSGSAIATLIAQNQFVTQRRGGAPWVEFDAEQKLKVRVKNDNASLPKSFEAFSKQWVNSYFLGSFLNVIAQQNISYE